MKPFKRVTRCLSLCLALVVTLLTAWILTFSGASLAADTPEPPAPRVVHKERITLAREAIQAQDWKGAIAVLTEALGELPEHTELLYARALLAERLDRLDQTEADLRRLSVPTRLVCGTRSNDVAHAIVDHLHRLLPQSRCWLPWPH